MTKSWVKRSATERFAVTKPPVMAAQRSAEHLQ